MEDIIYELLRIIMLLDSTDRRYIKNHIWVPEDGEDKFKECLKKEYKKLCDKSQNKYKNRHKKA